MPVENNTCFTTLLRRLKLVSCTKLRMFEKSFVFNNNEIVFGTEIKFNIFSAFKVLELIVRLESSPRNK